MEKPEGHQDSSFSFRKLMEGNKKTETINPTGKIEAKQHKDGKLEIKIKGKKGTVDLQQEYLDRIGFQMKVSNMETDKDSNITYLDRKVIYIDKKMYNPVKADEERTKPVFTDATPVEQTMISLHEIGHALSDPDAEKDKYIAQWTNRANEINDSLGIPATYSDPEYKQIVLNLAIEKENNELEGWLQMAHLGKDIREKTGYDYRQEFSDFEEFFDKFPKAGYESHAHGNNDLLEATGQQDTSSEKVFDIENVKAQMKDIWDSMDE